MPQKRARVTSSSTRSRNRGRASVSSDKGRQARARVSTAQPTSSTDRPTSGGRARVTQNNKPGTRGQARAVTRRTQAARRTQSARAQRMNRTPAPAPAPAAKPQGTGVARAVDRRQQANRRAASARTQRQAAASRRAAAAARPDGRQPRAITNGRSATMRQIRAKAVQARRMAEGKPVRGGARGGPVRLPNSAKAGRNLPREGARALRVPGDSGQLRARQANYQRVAAQRKAAAQANRATRAAADLARRAGTVASSIRNFGRGGAAAAGLQAYNTGDSTLAAARKRGDLSKRRAPTPQEEASYRQQERAARIKLARRKREDAAKPAAASFDDAFRSARKAGVKSFTWRGKQYTTDMA